MKVIRQNMGDPIKWNEIVLYSCDPKMADRIAKLIPAEYELVVKRQRDTVVENVALVILEAPNKKTKSLLVNECGNFSILGALDEQPFIVITHPQGSIHDQIVSTIDSYRDKEFLGYVCADKTCNYIAGLIEDILNKRLADRIF